MYLGDFADDSTVNILFTTSDKNGGAVDPLTPFENADFKIYKDNGTSEKTSMSAGVTVATTFDSVTGLHSIIIDTSDNTDAGFWATGSDYMVILDPSDETIDSETVVAVIAQFSIENRFMRGTDSGATEAKQDIIDTNLDATLVDTGTTLPALINTINTEGGTPSLGD